MTALPLRTILHLDDDDIMRMTVKKSLERSQKGFEISSCASKAEFMEKLGSLTPDLLIIDVRMPDISGPDLVRSLRQNSITTPVVFMTGLDDLEITGHDDLDPVIGVIRKPFSPSTIGDDLLGLWNGHCKSGNL